MERRREKGDTEGEREIKEEETKKGANEEGEEKTML